METIRRTVVRGICVLLNVAKARMALTQAQAHLVQAHPAQAHPAQAHPEALIIKTLDPMLDTGGPGSVVLHQLRTKTCHVCK